MTRIVTTHYRYRPPPRKKQAAPLDGPAVVTSHAGKPKVEPAVTAPPPANDDRKPAGSKSVQPTLIVATASRKHRIKDGPTLPMELPLSRKPVEREEGDYKRLKAAMTRRLRGETN